MARSGLWARLALRQKRNVSDSNTSLRKGPRVAYELVFLAADVGNVHVVGGWAEILELLASKDVNGNEMDLGVTVLARLGGGHVDDLARAALDHDEAVLAQSRALHRVRGRGAGVGALEGVIMLPEADQD